MAIRFQRLPTNGIYLHTALAGPPDGEPVFLLHGFPEAWFGWEAQICMLRASITLLSIALLSTIRFSSRPWICWKQVPKHIEDYFKMEHESTPERSVELFHPDLSVLPPPAALPAGYRLRTWQDGDETKVPPILGDAFFGYPEMGTYESFHRFLARRGGFVPENIFVIEDGTGQPVGTTTARFESPLVGRLHRVGVQPAHQGRRLGKALAHRALSHLADHGVTTAYVQTEDNRPAAISVYLWAGFQPVLDRAHFTEKQQRIPSYDLEETWARIYADLAAYRKGKG